MEIDRELMPVVPEYLAYRQQDCAEIERLLDSGAMETILALGHRLKGSGGSFGFDEITAIGEALELAARAPDVAGVKAAVARLERYLARVSVRYI